LWISSQTAKNGTHQTQSKQKLPPWQLSASVIAGSAVERNPKQKLNLRAFQILSKAGTAIALPPANGQAYL
jgi:hypothetical protein